jgi:hypothetical protein
VDVQPYCRNVSTTFYQQGGAPVNPPVVTSRDTGAPGVPIIPGQNGITDFGQYGLGVQPFVSPMSFGGPRRCSHNASS